MNKTLQQSRRRWPWFVVGILVGLPILPALDSAIRQTKRTYVLTQDLDVSAKYAFRNAVGGPKEGPVRGTLLAGARFRVEMEKGNAWYISLHTVVVGEETEPISKLVE